MDTQKLMQVARSSPTAENMFLVWALRERHTKVTDLPRFKRILANEGVTVNDDDYYKVFQELATLGIGDSSHVIRGRPLYFSWKVPVQTVGKAGLDGIQSKAVQVSARTKRSKPNVRIRSLTSASKLPVSKRPALVSQLRLVVSKSERSIPIILPGDATREELISIADAIRAIADERETTKHGAA